MKVKSDLLIDIGYTTRYEGSLLHRLGQAFRVIFKKTTWHCLRGKIYKKDIKKIDWI